MKNIIYKLLLGLVFTSFYSDVTSQTTVINISPMFVEPTYPEQNCPNVDSLIPVSNDTFKELDLNFTEITKDQFGNYSNLYIDTNSERCHFSDFKLTEEHHCDQICESFLVELDSGSKLFLPCDYDAGILGASLSPNCKQLIVCSSYDGPDYYQYYENRAEIFFFKIKGRDGLNSLKPSYKSITADWSIDDYTWISDTEIGLKIYSEQLRGDGEHLNFRYVKMSIPNIEK